jgi:hypothetical protein
MLARVADDLGWGVKPLGWLFRRAQQKASGWCHLIHAET